MQYVFSVLGEDVAFGKEEFVYNACDLLKRYCKNMTPPLLLHENAQSLYDESEEKSRIAILSRFSSWCSYDAMDVVETEAQIKAMRDGNTFYISFSYCISLETSFSLLA